ncbi:MAG TPA: pirin-like C-terminal cupin domain-containing protein, partial [Acinetobacter sp.]|nr:pirin-like C-terminal cupin domain-containing protein [Acinetobacter sp.]
DHYPELPVIMQDQIEFTVLVGEFLQTISPVHVHTPLVGVDLTAQTNTKTSIPLNPNFEYAFMALEGIAHIHGHELNADNLIVLEQGLSEIDIEIMQGQRILLIGGEPFESEILLWWNFVGRTMDDMQLAREQWMNHDRRFGQIPDYAGKRLEAPELPEHMRASK